MGQRGGQGRQGEAGLGALTSRSLLGGEQKKAACRPQEGVRIALFTTEDRGTWATRSQMPEAAEQGENLCLCVCAPLVSLRHSLHQP